MAEKYISVESVSELISIACIECKDDCEESDGIYADCNQCLLHDVKKKLSTISAADVRPVVRGNWEKHEDFDAYGGGRFVEWVCSECDKRLRGDWVIRNSHIEETPTENYCPNCGADMRRKTDSLLRSE